MTANMEYAGISPISDFFAEGVYKKHAHTRSRGERHVYTREREATIAYLYLCGGTRTLTHTQGQTDRPTGRLTDTTRTLSLSLPLSSG